jgi:hypothetical protein
MDVIQWIMNSGKTSEAEPSTSTIYNKEDYMKFRDYLEESLYSIPQSKNIVIVDEEYALRAKSTVPKVGTVEVFKNPTPRDRKTLGNIIRFTADNRKKVVYAWIYDQAHHVDVSKAVGIRHVYNDPDLLTGAAAWSGSKWVFSSSDFLKDFKRMVGSESDFVNALLNNDWSWADRYIDVSTTLDKLRNYIK